MNFAQLYDNNRHAVSSALRSMWCGEVSNDSQRAYAEQMNSVIEELFAPANAVPVVQCMNSYKSVFSVSAQDAKDLVGGFWTSSWEPYEHQYQSWKTLLKDQWIAPDGSAKPKSIVVTTGTGSGKTECFMMPLVYDLQKKGKSGQIQALFLYPLNALMEDQKERLQKLLNDTDIKFAVYNGDLPEKEPGETANTPEDRDLRRRIELVTGGEYEEVLEEDNFVHYYLKDVKYANMLFTREQVRDTPPNILLTNPTMLEYILLRGADSKLINPLEKSLDWVVIDETHTFTGAGAAELAMLLRRVLLAFDKNAQDVRFATSSATLGNTASEDPEEKERLKAIEMEKLRDFIAGITGVNREQVVAIDGERIGEDRIPAGQDAQRWDKIFKSDFIELDKLFPEGNISQKLQELDDMCAREDARVEAEGLSMPDMKLKVHYFYRVPNNGLYVRLDDHENGAFRIYTQKNLDEVGGPNEAPLLELSRCKHCGEYVAVAVVNTKDNTYQAPALDDSDMFDLVAQDEDESKNRFVLFGLSNTANLRGDNNSRFKVIGNRIESYTVAETSDQSGIKMRNWHIVGNTQCQCPYCNTKLSRKAESEKEVEQTAAGGVEDMRLQRFRLSADFISRMIAPSILDQLEKHEPKDPDQLLLHDGQQYISFVDSRQAAAKATMKQNLEEERLWFYSTIYHELCRRNALAEKYKAEAKRLKKELDDCDEDSDEYDELSEKLRIAKKRSKSEISWTDIADLFLKDKYCQVFCLLFIKRTANSEEMEDDDITPEMMEKYVHSIMVMYLAHRPASSASPETLGLFHACYPQLKKIKPSTGVDAFNSIISDPVNRIEREDWQDLIHDYMDFVVRNRQSVFLRIDGNNRLDIFSTVRFATEKPRRHPIEPIKMEQGKLSQSRIVRYLCALLVRDGKALDLKNAQQTYFDEISAVVDEFWNVINDPANRLLEESTRLDDNGRHVPESKSALRFNLTNLSFKLYDDVYLCDVKTDGQLRHTSCLRPISNSFKRFSPYMEGMNPIDLDETMHDQWTAYPYYMGSGTSITEGEVKAWAKKERSLLWDNGIWGENGVFADRLTDIHQTPNLFVQAEHTAQVDKDVARALQADFKDHTINILACSTTMEMGVDLGNLEVVLLSSVPPQPANYKQRAGRSGRNNKVRSVCITLCGSDAIGLRTLYHPVEKIINRPVRVPSVDLMSPQVVQRHVNAFLIREFGVFTRGENGGSLKQKLVHYFTRFRIERESKNSPRLVIRNAANETVGPANKLGDPNGTMYEIFNQECDKPLSDNKILKDKLDSLLHDTCFEGKAVQVVKTAKEQNIRCHDELSIKLEDYATALQNTTNTGFIAKLNMLYMEVMNTRLLSYWATNRFTPNANMPVNVLSLDLNSSGKRDYITNMTSSNPSYSLREAIAQYAPGNSVVVDGVVYAVRGIESSTLYQDTKAFKKIYRNTKKTVVDPTTPLVSAIPWLVNEQEALELVQPAGFLPDMNEGKSRILDSGTYTRVSAQLIDAEDWNDQAAEDYLFSIRSNRESGNAKILYYNEGTGHGYCYCPRCGRTVIETDVADPTNPGKLPLEMNTRMPKNPDKPRYHLAISGKDMHKACACSNNYDMLRRNVIIGDLLQTDFCEIRLRHELGTAWLTNRDDEESLLFTLGIVFTQSLVDILGKERGAVDFAIMPNGHLCIFDTNPGGAGYSNQLKDVSLMREVISASEALLREARDRKSKDMLLDKFTLRFIKYVDINAALEWIDEEKATR